MRRFFGKYRGKVTANKDPFYLGRVQVSVPAIFGEERLSWALPCTPYAGKDIGFFAIPPVNSNVWVEFEAGDPDYPIWAGCFWAVDELPAQAKVDDPVKVQVFKVNGMTLSCSSLGETKGMTLEIEEPVVSRKLKVVFNQDGIEINNADQLTIKVKPDEIELKNRQNTIVTLGTSMIQLKESAIEVQLTANDITLTCNPATLKLSTTSGIEIGSAPSTAKLSASGIEMSSTSASLKLSPAAVELTNAAASVKLSPISVNVNNGALEVI